MVKQSLEAEDVGEPSDLGDRKQIAARGRQLVGGLDYAAAAHGVPRTSPIAIELQRAG
jgi:hypothetical protein